MSLMSMMTSGRLTRTKDSKNELVHAWHSEDAATDFATCVLETMIPPMSKEKQEA